MEALGAGGVVGVGDEVEAADSTDSTDAADGADEAPPAEAMGGTGVFGAAAPPGTLAVVAPGAEGPTVEAAAAADARHRLC